MHIKACIICKPMYIRASISLAMLNYNVHVDVHCTYNYSEVIDIGHLMFKFHDFLFSRLKMFLIFGYSNTCILTML